MEVVLKAAEMHSEPEWARAGATLVIRGHLGHPGPQPGPAGSSVGLRLADDFRELTTRRSKWEGAEFVLGPGREGCWLESL